MATSTAWLLAGLYAVALLAIHLVATRGSGNLPAALNRSWGASAGTVGPRWWAQFTAPWFHEDWFHLGYNLSVLAATMPLAVGAWGPEALMVALLASPAAGFTVNLGILLPGARRGWQYAQAAVEPRLVGASVVIFAGAGLALAGSGWSWGWQVAVAGAFAAYEAVLATARVTKPFVGIYHYAGFMIGFGVGPMLLI